jgi:hypothetical protein
VHGVVGVLGVGQGVEVVLGQGDVVDSTARIPMSVAARARSGSRRYMSFTVVTPLLMPSR